MRIARIAKVAAGSLGAILLLLVALLYLPERRAPIADGADSRIITNVHVIDVDSGTAGETTSVVIRDGTISLIGDVPDGLDLPRFDGGGGYLLPAFWDMHVHTFQLSPQLHFPLWIGNGVLNVRDMMDCPAAGDPLIACAKDKRLWNAQSQRGETVAPRIVEIASFYFDRPDLSADEIRALSERYERFGVNALKVYNRLSPEAYRALAAQARDRDLRLVGHLPDAVTLDEAIREGQVSFEHAHVLPRECFARTDQHRLGNLGGLEPVALTEAIVQEIDPERCDFAIAALSQAGAWLVPTHVTREEDARAADPAYVDDPRLDYLDPLSRWAFGDDLAGTTARYPGVRGQRALQRYFEQGLALTGRAHGSGVKVLIGTDSTIGGFRYHDELVHLVSAGLTPADALRAATIDAARYSGMDTQSGTVAVGKRADLVLVAADPLQDISHTRDIRAVFQAGRLFDRRAINDLFAYTESEAGSPDIWVKLVWGYLRSAVSSEM